MRRGAQHGGHHARPADSRLGAAAAHPHHGLPGSRVSIDALRPSSFFARACGSWRMLPCHTSLLDGRAQAPLRDEAHAKDAQRRPGHRAQAKPDGALLQLAHAVRLRAGASAPLCSPRKEERPPARSSLATAGSQPMLLPSHAGWFGGGASQVVRLAPLARSADLRVDDAQALLQRRPVPLARARAVSPTPTVRARARATSVARTCRGRGRSERRTE